MTIQQYFGDARRSDPANRHRRAMLEKVWAIWITDVLQPSLPQDILLDLSLTERPAIITRALDLYVQRPELADQVQALMTRLIDAFDRLDRALLIVGAPGTGKTTLLLTLARDLLIRAAQDPEQPIPVVFPLSSWAHRRRALADWLVDALNEQYDVPRKTGQAWVDADQILPLLDGLDEVAAEHRAPCVEAINTFRQEHGLLPLVVCSRLADYEALGTRLRLQGALVVQPLTPQQVDSYLTQVGAPLAAVREALQEDATLGELLDTPLMLAIMSLAYAGESVMALRIRTTPAERRRRLFAAYIDRMFQRRSPMAPYTRPQTERWLMWLAWQMTQHSQTVFYLERLQPDWLPQRQRWVPTHGARLVASVGAGLIAGLCAWLVVGLVAGQGFGLDVGLDVWFFGPSFRQGVGPRVWLLGGLLGSLIGGLTGYAREIVCIERVHWSWATFLAELFVPSARRLVSGLHVGLAIGLGAGLVGGLAYGPGEALGAWLGSGFGIILINGFGVVLGSGLVYGLIVGLQTGEGFGLNVGLDNGLVFGLAYALILFGPIHKLYAGFRVGLSAGEIPIKAVPNEGIHRSARLAWISGLIWGLGGGLGFGLGVGLNNWLANGLEFGLVVGLGVGLGAGLDSGLRYGGRACLQHLLLRLGLRHNGAAPWQYVDFLDYAAERIFLRKVGGGYMFIHRVLQDYFAARHTDPGDAVKQDASG